MTNETPALPAQPVSRLRRFVNVEPGEVAALLASFAMFFALLSAYYIVRPVRDEIGVSLGKDALHRLFTVVFFVMIALVPMFGFVAARFPRRLVLPSIYVFFALNLVGFWLAMKSGDKSVWVAGTFFVWGSVFNLFVVSLFWSLMAELWTHAEAKRLYGFISAGGTAGALAGPLLTQGLVRLVAPVDLLLLSAALLVAAMIAGLAVRRLRTGGAGPEMDAAGGGILDGAIKVFTTPLFARIALFVFLANIVGTFFYLEQARLVASTIPDSAQRVEFFSGRDLAVSIATFLVEVFGTARVLQRFGVTVALLALPVTAAVGALLLSFDAALWVVAAVMVAERIVAFSLANPAVKVIYTLASPDEKYKVQNFIDTVVFRGGDATSGWLYADLGGGLGFAAGAMGAVAMPLVLVWIWIARRLGAEHHQRAAATA
ncbi:major facilitator transporter [Hyphomicrobium denitrificans 1NES1]|uniref:Major facilitator transporter n=1 Tax=Hyphomicrobium denitrificans 1NES1 TaxID=670307 RepID=N0B304_9HYPH|nr:MFS transporter [Hyphomicrobium denitrificans]AGK56557.1 major facilitator transporter [Hyphomicrobium denitrificans 1NES1]